MQYIAIFKVKYWNVSQFSKSNIEIYRNIQSQVHGIALYYNKVFTVDPQRYPRRTCDVCRIWSEFTLFFHSFILNTNYILIVYSIRGYNHNDVFVVGLEKYVEQVKMDGSMTSRKPISEETTRNCWHSSIFALWYPGMVEKFCFRRHGP